MLFAEDSVFCQSLDQSGLLSCCCNRDALAIAKPAADRLKFDDPVGQGKQGVILAATNIDAWHNGGATLADQNGTSRYAFTAVGLTPRRLELESRPLRVEPVPFLWAMENQRDGEREAG